LGPAQKWTAKDTNNQDLIPKNPDEAERAVIVVNRTQETLEPGEGIMIAGGYAFVVKLVSDRVG